MDIRLDPVRPEDKTFLVSVYASTRADEMAVIGWTQDLQDSFLRSQHDAQQRYYHSQFPDASFNIVRYDGHAVGQMVVERKETEIRLINIALLPEYRHVGIGTFLLRGLMEEARFAGKRVGLHVEQSNPARNLYHRLGFEVTGQQGFHVEMVWTAKDQISTIHSESCQEQNSAAMEHV